MDGAAVPGPPRRLAEAGTVVTGGAGGAPLHVTVDLDGDRAILVLSGEIDLCSRPSLAELLDAAMDGSCPGVELDLAKVSFINAAGLRVLCDAYHLGVRRGVALTVRRPSPHLVSLLRRVDPTAFPACGDVPACGDADSRSERDRQADERDRRAGERDRRADERDRQADERDRRADERDESAEDVRLLNEERGRLLDERHLSVLRHQDWEDIREDLANERERRLDRREQDC
jgi:anti-anti-sigma factor